MYSSPVSLLYPWRTTGIREQEGNEMLIAVDAMGGDNAPHEVCRGAAIACANYPDLEIALVGKENLVREHLEGVDSAVSNRIHVVHAEDSIGMEESPVVAMRRKKNSSLRVAMEMVHSKEAQGCVSAGNTGAIVAGGVLVIGRIPGIERPGLGMPLPALNRTTMLIDVGATVRVKPENLFQFALMGQIYMRHIFGVKEPEITLLSNGEEEIKGDEVVMAAREMIRAAKLNFKGYVEGRDIPFGKSDLVVCDGFTGNVLLKFIEGFGEAVYALLKEEMGNRLLPKMGMVFMLPMIKELWTRFDYEGYGGTPLLGVNGAVIKAHGRSKSTAIANAIRVARDFVEKRGVEQIREELLEGGKL